jgi:hypothetical protein
MAALFESDRNEALKRIAGAERAIVARARVLVNQSKDGTEKRRALDAALNVLRILKDYAAAEIAARAMALPYCI